MRDMQHDPNFPHDPLREYDSRVQWAAVAVLLLLCGGLIFAASMSSNETQTAMNAPAFEKPVTSMPQKP
jgi:hypothetical protein